MVRIMGNGQDSRRLRSQNAPITITRNISGATSTSFLILHGYGYDGSLEHWHNRLAQALTAAGIPVRYPRFPSPDTPSLGKWRRVLADELDRLEGVERVVVCHSLACLLWIHHATEVREPVNRLLLVAPPDDPHVPEAAAAFRVGTVEGSALRATSLAPPRVVHGSLDPYSPAGVPPWVGTGGCEIDEIEGAGHLNPDDGYGRWASCERWCLDPRERIA